MTVFHSGNGILQTPELESALQKLREDPVMAALIERIGDFEMLYSNSCFESLVRSIIAQHIHSKVARLFVARLSARMKDRVITPEAILRLRISTLRKVGLTNAKIEYIRDLARRTVEGEVVFEEFPHMSDGQVIERLTRVKGIGVWTAQIFLMFALRRPNILPTGDLNIRASMKRAYGLDALPTPAQMHAIAQLWQPWCSFACWYLWRSLDGTAQL